MLRRLLIANRGEIARRIIRTCKRLGIETVAICAPAEYYSPYAKEATYRHEFNSDELAQTFLSVPAILAVAKSYGADSIHPGYGFLSENAEFAEQVAAAGLVFVGPSPEILRGLGEKHRGIALAKSLGVPTVPGVSDGERTLSVEELAAIGFPLMIKAAFGGGGRGMRLVRDISELEEAVRSARRESKAAFGREEIIGERYIFPSRHVEVQLLGDKHGNLYHLFERECSFQRRYQKVIEEAPAPGISKELRQKIIDAALTLGRTAKLDNAATVEFMLALAPDRAPNGEFFFMEVNPRLQVEHTVTEEITKLDIVELQLIAASGKPLPILQANISASGHAIQARICGEIPEQNFTPSLGTIHSLDLPQGPGIRVESSLDVGLGITNRYDSLLLKVIAHDASREGAADKLRSALDQMDIGGISNNSHFLVRTLQTDFFRSISKAPTSEVFPALHAELGVPPSEIEIVTVAFAGSELAALARTSGGIPPELIGFRADKEWTSVEREGLFYRGNLSPRRFELRFDGLERDIEFDARVVEVSGERSEGTTSIEVSGIAGSPITTSSIQTLQWQVSGSSIIIAFNRHLYGFRTYGREAFSIFSTYGSITERPIRAKVGSDSSKRSSASSILAPLPGRILEIRVVEGAKLEKGDALVVLESMKTEHFIYADHSGVVSKIHQAVGAMVKSKELLITVE